MHASHVAITAATAAAAIRKRQEAEEESMTSYSPDELAQDWEFKIIRSNTEAFGKPEAMRQMLVEEAQAGWMLVEKFDNGRVRLKRPRAARANDAALPAGVDAYRSYYGIGMGRYLAVSLFITFVILFGIIGLLMLLVPSLR